jgi:hypothetical protein
VLDVDKIWYFDERNEMKRNGGKREYRGTREEKWEMESEKKKISGVGGSVGFTSRPFYIYIYIFFIYVVYIYFI